MESLPLCGPSPRAVVALRLVALLALPPLGCGVVAQPPPGVSHDELMQDARVEAPEEGNGIRLVFLEGSPYEMGYQHGALLAEEIAELRAAAEDDIIWATFLDMVETLGPEDGLTYVDHILESSLPTVVEECEGLVEGSGHAVELHHCLVLSSITYIIEDLVPRYLPGIEDLIACSGFVASGEATVDGRMIHGRNLDYLTMEPMMAYPTIFVRAPEGALRHVSVAWPGQVGVLTGMNERGLTVEINENSCPDARYRDMSGAPALQQVLDLLSRAGDLDEAAEILAAADQASCQILLLSHGPTGRAAVFELWAGGLAVRDIEGWPTGDLLFATNHFVHPEARPSQEPRDIHDLFDNSVSRYTRLRERLTGGSLPPHGDLRERNAPDYAYGRIDVEMAADILRDPLDLRPDRGRMSFPCTEHEDGLWALGNNHNIHSAIMIGESLELWLAAGWDRVCRNAIYSPYVGFDLGRIWDGDGEVSAIAWVDPPYNGSYGSGIYQ